MTGLLQRIENSIQGRRLIPRGGKILVAVSGGLDSMVLLHALEKLSAKHKWKITIAHFNHQLRGRSSDADEKLVRKISAKLKLPVFAGRADIISFAKKTKLSVEMAARKLRHEFLAKTARRQKISVVALAHHADDQVELFFLRILRGAGGEGLAGMKWQSPSPADKTISLIRPLLDLSKVELLAFARENKINFRDDTTNFSNNFLRNRIRNELLPLLQKSYQSGLSKTILRLMEIIGTESEFVGEAAKSWLAKPPVEFEKLPMAVQRKVLQLQLAKLGQVSDFDLIERLRKSAGKFISVNSDLAVARDDNGKLGQREELEKKFSSGEVELKLSGRAGRAEFAGRKFCWDLKDSGGLYERLRRRFQTEFFDADKIGGEIILRHWRAGDRFQPIGLKSAAKLQDLFVNAKIPAARRRNLILATTTAGEIFWVDGLRIGEHFKLVSETKRVLAWNCPKIAA